MPTNAITTSSKRSAILLALRWVGASGITHARYAAWDEDLTRDLGDGYGSASFAACPTMDVTLPAQTSGIEQRSPLTVDFPVDDVLSRMSDGLPHAPVFVTAAELLQNDAGSLQDVLLTHYRGRLATARRNPDGRLDRVRMEFVGPRNRFKFSMGVPANHTCAWTFGDDSALTGAVGNNCKIDASALLQTGTLTVISGKTVTITGLTTPSGTANDSYWRRGWIARGHLSIQIREWVRGSPTTFELTKQPPGDWAGATVTACPGCDKTKTTCLTRWNNIARFMGFGDSIPSRNPLQELP